MPQPILTIGTSGQMEEVSSAASSAGAGDSGKIVALDANGLLNLNMMPAGVGAAIATVTASENLAAGDVVNIYNNAGTPNVRKADATTTGKEATGYVLSAVTSSNAAEVRMNGVISGLSSLTTGTIYYLSTTAGGITSTPPTGSGNVLQEIGAAISATALSFAPKQATKRA